MRGLPSDVSRRVLPRYVSSLARSPPFSLPFALYMYRETDADLLWCLAVRRRQRTRRGFAIRA